MEFGKLTSLNQFISNVNKLIIPTYQRKYDWKEKMIIKLIDDIQKNDNNRDYLNYYGNIAYTKINYNEKNGMYDFIIIDGQQRITTIVLIKCVIYVLLMKEDIGSEFLVKGRDRLINNILNYIYYDCTDYDDDDYNANGIISEKTDFRLQIEKIDTSIIGFKKNNEYSQRNNNLSDVFEYCIKQRGIDDDNKLKLSEISRKNEYVKQYKVILNLLNGSSRKNGEKFSFKQLLELSKKIDRINIGTIYLEENENINHFFEIINSNSQALESIDLIRNIIFSKRNMNIEGRNDLKRKIFKYWDLIEKFCAENPLSDVDFFKYYIMIEKGWGRASKDIKLYLEVRKVIKKMSIPDFLEDSYNKITKIIKCFGTTEDKNPLIYKKIDKNEIDHKMKFITNILNIVYASKLRIKDGFIILVDGYIHQKIEYKDFIKYVELLFKYILREKVLNMVRTEIVIDKKYDSIWNFINNPDSVSKNPFDQIEEDINNNNKLDLSVISTTAYDNKNAWFFLNFYLLFKYPEKYDAQNGKEVDHIIPSSKTNDIKLKEKKYSLTAEEKKYIGNLSLLSSKFNKLKSNKMNNIVFDDESYKNLWFIDCEYDLELFTKEKWRERHIRILNIIFEHPEWFGKSKGLPNESEFAKNLITQEKNLSNKYGDLKDLTKKLIKNCEKYSGEDSTVENWILTIKKNSEKINNFTLKNDDEDEETWYLIRKMLLDYEKFCQNFLGDEIVNYDNDSKKINVISCTNKILSTMIYDQKFNTKKAIQHLGTFMVYAKSLGHTNEYTPDENMNTSIETLRNYNEFIKLIFKH